MRRRRRLGPESSGTPGRVTPAARSVVYEALTVADILRHGSIFLFDTCDMSITVRGVRFASTSSAKYGRDRDGLANEATPWERWLLLVLVRRAGAGTPPNNTLVFRCSNMIARTNMCRRMVSAGTHLPWPPGLNRSRSVGFFEPSLMPSEPFAHLWTSPRERRVSSIEMYDNPRNDARPITFHFSAKASRSSMYVLCRYLFRLANLTVSVGEAPNCT